MKRATAGRPYTQDYVGVGVGATRGRPLSGPHVHQQLPGASRGVPAVLPD